MSEDEDWEDDEDEPPHIPEGETPNHLFEDDEDLDG